MTALRRTPLAVLESMFKASALEYRLRFLIHLAIFALGFAAPWNYFLHLDPPGANAHLWGALAADLSRLGTGNIASTFNLLLALAIACACAGALLRTWGAAYLGADVVQSPSMHTAVSPPASGLRSGLLQDGPFRHLRNPLYLGTFLHALALSLLMPSSGAIFCILGIALLQSRLILAEEPYLTARLGVPYLAYCALVPRIVPSLRPRIAATGLKPRWLQAVRGEIYFWGVACSFALVGPRYDEMLLLKCIIVSFGLSLVAQAFASKPSSSQNSEGPER